MQAVARDPRDAEIVEVIVAERAGPTVGRRHLCIRAGLSTAWAYRADLDDTHGWSTKRYLNMDHLFQMELMNNTETAEASAG